MNNITLSEPIENDTPNTDACPLCTLHICISCRRPGTPREPKENRPGFILYHKIRDALVAKGIENQVNLRPAQCLSICPRPCGIALSSAGSWTYLFGDQDPIKTVDDIVECVSVYLKKSDGFMPRGERPISLRRSILGRVPPMGGESQCT